KGRPDVLEDLLSRELPGFDNDIGPVVAVRELGDVVALVALLRHDVSAAPREKTLAEKPDLASGVIYVVLAPYLPTATAHDPSESVAVRSEPPVAHVEWPRRVRGHELDLDALSGSEIG